MNENILCTNISNLRRANGLTQEQLAGRLGITYQAVSKWENGQSCPDVMLLPDIADIFGVTIDQLYGRLSKPTPPSQLAAEQEEQVRNLKFPWPDDNNLYAVLFRGHELITGEPPACSGEYERIRFEYSGPALNICSCFSVACDEKCKIEGSITAGGDVACGDVKGNVNAGGSVNCGDAGGSINACGNINCGDVGLNASAGGSINCGDVGTNASADSNVSCRETGSGLSSEEHTSPAHVDISGISKYVSNILSDVLGKNK